VRLLSDRIQEFIDWLEANTDFGEWDQSVKTEVHKQLIVFMISDKQPPTEESGHAFNERRKLR
jgi:hypothetical protein